MKITEIEHEPRLLCSPRAPPPCLIRGVFGKLSYLWGVIISKIKPKNQKVLQLGCLIMTVKGAEKGTAFRSEFQIFLLGGSCQRFSPRQALGHVLGLSLVGSNKCCLKMWTHSTCTCPGHQPPSPALYTHKDTNGYTHTDTNTDRYTDTQIQMQTHKDTDTCRHKHIHTHTNANTQRDTHRYTHTYTNAHRYTGHTDTDAHTNTNKYTAITHIDTQKYTNAPTDIYTSTYTYTKIRYIHPDTDRHTNTHRYKDTHRHIHTNTQTHRYATRTHGDIHGPTDIHREACAQTHRHTSATPGASLEVWHLTVFSASPFVPRGSQAPGSRPWGGGGVGGSCLVAKSPSHAPSPSGREGV